MEYFQKCLKKVKKNVTIYIKHHWNCSPKDSFKKLDVSEKFKAL